MFGFIIMQPIYLMAVTRTPVSIEFNTWLTWLIVINCNSSSDLIKSIARRHTSKARLASPDTAATFLPKQITFLNQ